jgi:hypothetical protein
MVSIHCLSVKCSRKLISWLISILKTFFLASDTAGKVLNSALRIIGLTINAFFLAVDAKYKSSSLSKSSILYSYAMICFNLFFGGLVIFKYKGYQNILYNSN